VKRLISAILIAAVFVFTACPAFGQEILNPDAIRGQIRKLEEISVEGRSVAVQRAHNRALLGLYTQLQTALQQEIDELKKIQALTASSDTATRQDIANELNKLASASTETDKQIARLQNIVPAQPSSTDVNSAMTAGTPKVPNPAGTTFAAPNIIRPEPASNGPGSASMSLSASNLVATPNTPQTGDNFNDALNKRIQEIVRARIQQRDPTKQTEPPNVANSSTSLVNMPSAGDLVNVGFALAGLTSNNADANATESVSVTASAYAFYALAKNQDLLNPDFYNRHPNWRRLSFTLGYDNEKLKDGTTQKAPIFGWKYLIVDKRDPSRRRNQEAFQMIGKNLRTASTAFGNISQRIVYSFAKSSAVRTVLLPQFSAFLSNRLKTLDANSTEFSRIKKLQAKFENGETSDLFLPNSEGVPPNPGEPRGWSPEELEFYTDNFQNVYLGPDYRVKLKDAFGQKVLDDLDAFLTEQLADTKAFEDLSDSTRDALESIRRAPQFSFNFLTKQRAEIADEYQADTIFDYGLADRINLTLNGSFLYRDSKLVGADTRGGKFAGQFRFQLTPEKLAGRNPLFFFLSGNAELLSGFKPVYKAQAKLNIPLFNGVDFPFSLTYANRNELGAAKNKTRLQFGFAIDTARILQALTPK